MKKVLFINGSPRKNGHTVEALRLVEDNHNPYVTPRPMKLITRLVDKRNKDMIAKIIRIIRIVSHLSFTISSHPSNTVKSLIPVTRDIDWRLKRTRAVCGCSEAMRSKGKRMMPGVLKPTPSSRSTRRPLRCCSTNS